MFLSPDDFGESAVIGGETVSVQFFDRSELLYEYRQSSYDSPSGGVESGSPFVLAKRSDVQNIKTGDTVAIRGTEYSVNDIQFKRSDIVKLLLTEKRDRPFNL